jgi:hypothetical protein
MDKHEEHLMHLDDTLLIGTGGSRECYIHPDDPNLCIKTIKNKKYQRSVDRETRYFKKLQKQKKSFQMISKYYGRVKTDQGEGEVFELVRDYDGKISKNLKYYLARPYTDPANYEKIVEQIEVLRVYLREERILFSDLCFHNVLAKKVDPEDFELVVIDGIGHNQQIPLHEYAHAFADKRLDKKWEKFRVELIRDFGCKEEDVKHFFD